MRRFLTSRRSTALGAVLWSLAVAAGCGGKVDFYPPKGTGGTGGAPSTTTSTTKPSTTSVTSTSVTSTSTGNPQTVCQEFCSKTGTCVFSSDCVAQCQALYTPQCADITTQLLQCFEKEINPSNCMINGNCDMLGQAYSNCTQGSSTSSSSTCQNNTCTGNETSCSCAGTCFGSNVHAICSLNGGPAECTCYVGATPVGSCQDNVTTACDLENGCCATFFAPQPD